MLKWNSFTPNAGSRRAALALTIVVALGLQGLAPVAGAQTGIAFDPPVFAEIGGPDAARQATADFNQDGHLDVAVTTGNKKINFLYGDGSGALLLDNSVRAYGAGDIATADFNNDGILDFAIAGAYSAACSAGGGVQIFLGAGGQTARFAFRSCLASGGVAVRAADFDGDGNADLAIGLASNHSSATGLMVALGLGDGTFAPPVAVARGANVRTIKTVDYNGDGHIDIVANGGVLLNAGDGTFAFSSVGPQTVFDLGDFNGDGLADIARVFYYNTVPTDPLSNHYVLSIAINGGAAGSGTLVALSGPAGDLRVLDLDGDGNQDVVLVAASLNGIQVWLGNGDGSLQAPIDVPVGNNPSFLASGDWNEDSFTDLMVVDRPFQNDSQGWVLLQVPHAQADTTPPSVSLSAPAAGATLSNTVSLTASASDDVGVTRVDFYNGGGLIASSAGPNFSVAWDTTRVADGAYTLSAEAFDAAGNSTISATVGITVNNGAPTITSVAPAVSAVIGAPYTYQVVATGNPPVNFTLASAPAGMSIGATTGTITWTPAPNQVGAHSVTVVASNASGSARQSYVLTALDQTAPTMPVLSGVNLGADRVKLSWTAATDDVGVAGYTLYIRTVRRRFHPPRLVPVQTNITTTSITVALGGAAHTYAVAAVDAAGNTSAPSNLVSLAPLRAPSIYHPIQASGEIVWAVVGQGIFVQSGGNRFSYYAIGTFGNPVPTLSLVSGPAGMQVSTGRVTWVPPPSAAGTTVSATVRATNSQGSADLIFSIPVRATAAVNSAPVVTASAMPVQLTLPNNTATLSGTAQDDGLPNPPAALSYVWTQIAGTAPVVFGTPNALSTTVTMSVAGSYSFQLTVSDGALSKSATTGVYVAPAPPANQAPWVRSTFQPLTLMAPSNVARLGGVFSLDLRDDGLPNPPGRLSFSWTMLSGPAPVTFDTVANATTFNPQVLLHAAGSYRFQLTVSDGALSATATQAVTLVPANQAPVVNAGPQQSATVATPLTLTGSATDDGLPNGTLSYAWSLVAGPGSVSFGTPNAALTTATFTAAGTYTLSLAVSDGLKTGTAETTVVVSDSAPPPPAGPTPTGQVVELQGTISAVAVDSIVVNGTTVRWTASTIIKFNTSTQSFAIGQPIQLKGDEYSDGSVVAIKVEVG